MSHLKSSPRPAPATKRFIVHPGWVFSPHDGERHYLGFRRLCRLYGVDHQECLNADRPEEVEGLNREKFTHLRPRSSGRYTLPLSHHLNTK